MCVYIYIVTVHVNLKSVYTYVIQNVHTVVLMCMVLWDTFLCACLSKCVCVYTYIFLYMCVYFNSIDWMAFIPSNSVNS